jgi:hypothetical protein
MRFIFACLLRPSASVQEEETPFMLSVFASIKQQLCLNVHALQKCVLRWIKPPTTSLTLGTFADLTRGKAELLAENALLRQQLIILRASRSSDQYTKRRTGFS